MKENKYYLGIVVNMFMHSLRQYSIFEQYLKVKHF